MNNTQKQLFSCINYQIHDKRSTELNISEKDFDKLYSFANRNDLAHLLYDPLSEFITTPASFESKKAEAILRCSTQMYVLNEIEKAFIDSNVDYAILKGSIIRNFYPEPWMRTSADIDILVHEHDIKNASRILENNLGFTHHGLDGAIHISFIKGLANVELHTKLIPNDSVWDTDDILGNVWSHISSHQLDFKLYYYFHLIHIAKHLSNSGCGIRPFLDLWIIRNKWYTPEQVVEASDFCRNAGLGVFERNCVSISEKWFGISDNSPDIDSDFERFILENGIYGSTKSNVVLNIGKRNKIKYLFYRTFMPYNLMCIRYPIVKKVPFLLPFMWIVRWVQVITQNDSKRVRNEALAIANTSNESANAVNQMLIRIGL